MIRIKWVDPKKEKTPTGSLGEVRGSSVVLYRGRADPLTEAHERAHIALGHYKREKVTPERYIEREVDAHLYTYRKLGKPRRLVTQIRGNLQVLVDGWGISYEEALEVISGTLKGGKGVPSSWKRDLDKVRSEVYG